MKHSKELNQIKFAILLKDYVNIPFIKFRKRWEKWQVIQQFAAEHRNCCDIKFDKTNSQ